jgi:hypothetical protein
VRLGEELLVDPVRRPTIFDGGRVIGFRQITGHGGVLFLSKPGLKEKKPVGVAMLRENPFLKGTGFTGCEKLCFRARLYRLRKNSVLYQGTTLVVP